MIAFVREVMRRDASSTSRQPSCGRTSHATGVAPLAEMARKGKIPKGCIAKGTGDGKEWKFIREHIDRWIAAGRPQT